MKSLLRVISIAVVAVIVFALTYWVRLDSNQQKILLEDIRYWQEHGSLSPRMQKNLSSKFSQDHQPLTIIKDEVSTKHLADQKTAERAEQLQSAKQTYLQRSDYICYRTPSKKVTSKKSKVYMWVDESGRKHFSDQNTHKRSKDISSSFASRADYFEIKITSNDQLPAFFKQDISADLRQVFYILSQGLALEGLPKILLNLRVFMQKSDFDAYKQQHAPGLGHATGFFNPRTNEAAVFYNKNYHKQSMGLIRHESSHVIMAALFGYTPIWFNEGLAQYFETLYLQGQQKQVSPNLYAHTFLQRYLQASGDLALAEFFEYYPMQFYQAKTVRLNYYTAWAMMHFLLSDEKGKAIFTALTKTMQQKPCQSVDMQSLLNRYYHGGLPQFTQHLQQWLLSADLPTHNY